MQIKNDEKHHTFIELSVFAIQIDILKSNLRKPDLFDWHSDVREFEFRCVPHQPRVNPLVISNELAIELGSRAIDIIKPDHLHPQIYDSFIAILKREPRKILSKNTLNCGESSLSYSSKIFS
jgi:hypothetical protein